MIRKTIAKTAIFAAAFSALPSIVHAQTSGTWISNTSASWNNAANWGGSVPNGGGTATFLLYPSYAPASTDITLDTTVSLSQLVIDTPRAYTIRNTAGNFINFTGPVNLNVISSGVVTPSFQNFGMEIRANLGGSSGLIKSGAGAVTLGEHGTGVGSDNTFTGSIQLNAGTLVLAAYATSAGNPSDAVLGNAANNIIMNGGALAWTASSFSPSTAPFVATFSTSRSITMNSTGTFNATAVGEFNGVISGAQALNKRGNNIMVLGAANTYTGTTNVFSGSLVMRGALGSATLSSNGFGVSGVLTLDNLTAGNNNNRLADTGTNGFNGGQFALLGQSAGSTTETVGGLALVTGSNRVLINDPLAQSSLISNGTAAVSTGATVLTASSLTRFGRSTVYFTGNNLGTAGAAQVLFGFAPTGQLLGGNGAAGAKNISILPYAMGSTTPALGQFGDSFVTYGATGIRPLADTEYNTFTAAGATDNVLVAGDEIGVTGKTINALNIRKNGAIAGSTTTTFSGSGVLNVTSGAVAFTGRTTNNLGTTNFNNGVIEGFDAINFGSREGIFHISNNNVDAGTFFTSNYTADFYVNSDVQGSNGITIDGQQDSATYFNAVTTYTGDTTVVGGNFVPAGDGSIGAAGDLVLEPGVVDAAIVFNHNGSTAQIGASRNIRVQGTSPREAYLGCFNPDSPLQVDAPVFLGRKLTLAFPSTSPGTFNGVISGTGVLSCVDFSRQIINGNNTYSGGTELGLGTWEIGSNTAFGTGTIFTANIGDLFNRPAIIATGGPRTLANNWAFRLGGSVTQPLDSIEIGGSNDITLSGNLDFGGFAQRFFVSNTALTTISGSISRGELAKDGPGTLVLSGNNIYTGRTVVTNGALVVASNNALGSGNSTEVQSSAALELAGGVTSPENLSISGGGLDNNGVLRSLGVANTLSATVSLATSSTLWVDPASTLTHSGNIIATASQIYTKIGGGTLVLAGATPGFLGTITNPSGTLRLQANGAGGNGTMIIGNGAAMEFSNNAATTVTVKINGDGITGTGALRNISGNNSVKVVTLQNLTSNTIAVDAGTLTVNTYLDGGGNSLTKAGAGRLQVAALQDVFDLNINQGTLAITPNGSSGRASVIGSIAFGAGAKLDLNDNDAILQNASLSQVRSQIVAGYNGGAWNGSGIVSSSAAISASPRMGLGYGTPATTSYPSPTLDFGYGPYTPLSTDVIVRYTVLGDLDLSGTVNSIDFNKFVLGYGLTANAYWTDGDFDYDGKVNTKDFNFLAGGFGVTLPSSLPWPSLGVVVPEPTSVGLLGMAVAGLFARRRRL